MNLLIIGGGPGGYVAAIYAAKNGLNVTLIEKDKVGGTCLNRGCIPTKVILHSAQSLYEANHFEELGIDVEKAEINYPIVAKRKEKVVTKLRGGVEFLLKKNGVKVIYGEAEFVSDNVVLVNGEKIEADYVIIASGSRPADIPFAQADGKMILNSDHALALSELPKSMLIVGGGVIGCEFAQAYARMGMEVTIVEMLPRILANMDEDISSLMTKVLMADGVKILCGCALKSVQKEEDGILAACDTNGVAIGIAAQRMLVATGRKPNVEALKVEKAGVLLTQKGFVEVDDTLKTSNDAVYAIGDVTGKFQLAHVASHQGIAAVKNILGEEMTVNYDIVPQCVYTNPEIASMGKTAQDAGCAVKTGVFPVSANGRAMIEGVNDGFSKAVVDAEEGTVLGIHIVAPNATEMISAMAGIIGFEATTEDVDGFIFAHPSVSEIIHESIMDAQGYAIHK